MALEIRQQGDDDAPSRQPANIAFYYDFASPESYLALERLAKSLAKFAPELIPVSAEELDPLPLPDTSARRDTIEALAAGSDVLPLVWPADFPDLDTTDAIVAATYAKSIGKVAVFSLSLFRQIYAAGADPSSVTTIYLAGAASEIHPRAIDGALARDRMRERADENTAAAKAAGVTSVPALRIGQRLMVGPALLQDAAEVMREALRGFDPTG